MEQREGLKLDPETLRLHSRVAIVTGTSYPNWYRDHPKSIADTEKIRGDLALQAMREAVDRGYNIIVTDRGSSSDFLEEAKDIGEIVHPREGKERAAGRRQGYELASKVAGVDVIIWTEAEKVSLITDCIDIAIRPILDGEADVVVPKRREDLFAQTYPDYMHDSEVAANEWYDRNVRKFHLWEGQDILDMYFGPKIFRNDPRLLEIFTKHYQITGKLTPFQLKYLDPEEGSDTQFFPVVEALARGYKVASVEVPFKYPTEQKANETTDINDNKAKFAQKRNQQKFELSDELIQFIRVIFRSSKAKIREVDST